jgi:hypothetical protein
MFISDPGSGFYHPRSRVKKAPDYGIKIHNTELTKSLKLSTGIFNPKNVIKLSEI